MSPRITLGRRKTHLASDSIQAERGDGRWPRGSRRSPWATAKALAAWLLLMDSMMPICLAAQASLAQANRAWDERATVLRGRLADPERIEEAIRAYRTALDEAPAAVEPRWKFLRAMHYLIEFTDAGESRKEEAVLQSVALAESWVADLDDETGSGKTDRGRLYFWSAIIWGARGQRAGLLTIVRQGLATKMHDYATRAVTLDPTIERGGGYRLLSRMHASLPKVPFVSGWVDRDQVLPLAEKAFAIDPEDPGNRLVLAMALLDRVPKRRADATALLQDVSGTTPRQTLRVEDLAIREEALERLAEQEQQP